MYVALDGKPAGTTPSHVVLKEGTKVSLTATMPGHAPMTKELGPALEPSPILFTLQPLPYVLVVRTTPAGGELNALGVTAISPAPLELGHVSGNFSVNAGKEGYQRTSQPVRLSEFTEQDGVMRATLQISLSPLPAAQGSQTRTRAQRARPRAQASTVLFSRLPIRSSWNGCDVSGVLALRPLSPFSNSGIAP